MNKKKVNISNLDRIKASPHSSKLTNKELAQIKNARDLLLPLKEKYQLSVNDLINLIEEELKFPISIINKKLTVLGSIVKYLKEEKKLSLRKIAQIIGRDERNVWNVYNISKQRYPKRFSIKKVKFWVSVSIFSQPKLSALESIVAYLKDELSLTYHKIALLLKRDDRTIWTVYQRALKKKK